MDILYNFLNTQEEINELYLYLTKIFGDKLFLNEEDNFLEKILSVCSKYDDKDEKLQNIIKEILKSKFDFTKQIENELFSKQFNDFSNKFSITRNELISNIEKAKNDKLAEFYEKPEIKKIIAEIKGELPVTSARVYNISLGLVTKINGQELTLKEYSELVGEDYEVNLKILENAKNLIAKKVSRRIYKNV